MSLEARFSRGKIATSWFVSSPAHPVVHSCEYAVNKHPTLMPIALFQETDHIECWSYFVQKMNSNFHCQAGWGGCRGGKTDQGGTHIPWEALLLWLQMNVHRNWNLQHFHCCNERFMHNLLLTDFIIMSSVLQTVAPEITWIWCNDEAPKGQNGNFIE